MLLVDEADDKRYLMGLFNAMYMTNCLHLK